MPISTSDFRFGRCMIGGFVTELYANCRDDLPTIFNANQFVRINSFMPQN